MHSLRALVNAGNPAYQVTAEKSPAFLYEDPSNYDPNNVFVGLLRGPFLVRVRKFKHHRDLSQRPSQCFQALYISPARATQHSSTKPTPARSGLVKKYRISKITEPLIVYTALQVSLLFTVTHSGMTPEKARFSISSQDKWTGVDGVFDYDEFVSVLFELFKLDPNWTEETLDWWNQ